MATKSKGELVEIRPIETAIISVTVQGTTPLIVHAWSEKAKRMMLETQTGVSKGKKKEIRNPVDDFINSMYWITPKPDESTEEAYFEAINNGARFGFPATAFKQAAISASYRAGWSKDKVSLQGAFFIVADENGLIEILSKEPPEMREDMVTIGMGSADLRYRGEFKHWSAKLTLRYNKNSPYNIESIINMINAGGFSVGIGEWRPEKGGQNGMFEVCTNG